MVCLPKTDIRPGDSLCFSVSSCENGCKRFGENYIFRDFVYTSKWLEETGLFPLLCIYKILISLLNGN